MQRCQINDIRRCRWAIIRLWGSKSMKYQVNADEFSELDESVKPLYQEGEQGYTLQIEGLPEPKTEDVSGLKRKVDELLSEKKAVQSKMLEAEERAKREAQEKLKKANDYEQLYKSSEAERESTSKELAELKANLEKQRVHGEAVKIATSLTKDTARAKLLAEQITSRLSTVDNELRVLDSNGNLTVSTVDELTASIKAEYPFLVDGSQAAGGGASGSSSGAGDSKQVSRTDFDNMTPNRRMEFMKSGGKIID